MGETRRIALSLITPVQMREQTSDRIVQQYAADMARPTQTFPPIVLFYDGEHYWLADGMHRLLAAKTLGLPDIWARVLRGGEREAVEYAALEAPKDHSKVAYGEGDKQLRVKRMWEVHPEWHHGGASTHKIAESCEVNQSTVVRAMARYSLSDALASDTSTPSIDMPSPPLLPTPATNEKRSETPVNAQPSPEPLPPTPTVTVTRTRNGKTTTYQQRQPPRRNQPEPTSATETEPSMAAEYALTDVEPETTDDDPDPFLGMKINSVISLMAAFHNKVQATLGSDMPDKETLSAWWNTVEPREWEAFKEHRDWLRKFNTAINDFLSNHYDHGHLTTPPMVKKLQAKGRQK